MKPSAGRNKPPIVREISRRSRSAFGGKFSVDKLTVPRGYCNRFGFDFVMPSKEISWSAYLPA